jgi:myo-inositol-1(or 4)-monophosphatase
MTESLRSYLDFAIETAHLAGRLTLGYFQTGVSASYKADDSPFTIADHKSEELIRARIEKKFPRHSIIGEEFGEKNIANATHKWYIDPIDGTKSFLHGVPLYSVLIGLEIENKAEVGVAYFPALDEMICAATGEGCWWNGRRAHVSQVSQLKDAVVTTGEFKLFEPQGRADAWERLQAACGIVAGWGDAYGYLLVATGRAELMLDPAMSDWDCAPFPPILREAGGFFGDWNGNESIHAQESIATTQKLLPEVLRMIRGDS